MGTPAVVSAINIRGKGACSLMCDLFVACLSLCYNSTLEVAFYLKGRKKYSR